MKMRGPWLAVAVAVLSLTACETERVTDSSAPKRRTVRTSSQGFDESTQYLGSGGQVVTVASARAKVREQEAASYWHGDGVSGSPSIRISIGEQKAYFYKGGQLVGETPVCTGSRGHPTPVGSFRVIQRDKDHRSSRYGDYVDDAGYSVVSNVDAFSDPKPAGTHFQGAPMPNFLHFHDGAGLHSGYLPGFPDSHGCVRVPDRMAEIFFANAPLGTPVVVVN